MCQGTPGAVVKSRRTGDISQLQGKRLLNSRRTNSTVSRLDCTVFLSTISNLCETGFSVVAVIKRKYRMEQKHEDKHGTESKGGGIRYNSTSWEAAGHRYTHSVRV